uniref:Cytochrome P450 n=1 Tax=Leersia perrieri TaxID=77586 RepID=A0A0D9XIB8_9ORYZ
MAFMHVCTMLSLLLILFSYLLQLIRDTRRRLPPGPCPLPLIGSLHQIGHLPHRSFASLAKRHGPLMTVRLGTATCVVASSPDTARAVLQTHNASLAGRGRQDAWGAGGHAENSVFVLPPGRKWRLLRRLGAAHMFSKRRIEQLVPVCDEIVGDLVRRVAELAAADVVVDLLWRAMFTDGLDDDVAMRGELCDVVREATELLGTPNVSDFFPAVAALDLQGIRRRTAKLMEKTYRVIDAQIDRRMRSRGLAGGHGEAKDLLDVLLDMSKEDKEDGTGDLFVGGSDSTSTTIEWAMAELLQNPEIIKETLRLHPIVPLRLYEAEGTVEIDGYTIPKGSKVTVNAWAIHQNIEVWIQPEKFLPERFIGKDIDSLGRHFELIPFGSGRHICIGLPLANRMLHLILGSFMHQFEWAMSETVNENGLDMAEKFGLVVSMATRPNIMARTM